DDLAFAHQAAAHHAIGVDPLGRHVQIAHADVFARRVHHEVERFLPVAAQHGAAAGGDDVVQIGLAARGPMDALLPGGRADVLPLVTETARALADIEVAGLAEIVAPGIGIIVGRRLVGNQGPAVDAA